MKRETSLVKRIKKYLDKQSDVWYCRLAGGPFQERGLPDLMGLLWIPSGHVLFWAIEAKTDKGVLTPFQEHVMRKMAQKSGHVRYYCLAKTVEDVRKFMETMRLKSGLI